MSLFPFSATSTATLPLMVYERGFFQFVETSINLFKDYFEHLPSNEKCLARKLYIDFQNRMDEIYNEQHRQLLGAKERQFLQLPDNQRTSANRNRILYEYEKELLEKELQTRFGTLQRIPRFTLKQDPTTFTTQRWLKAFLAIKDVDVLVDPDVICESEEQKTLYKATKDKINALLGCGIHPLHTPDFFTCDAQRELYLRLVTKEEREIERLEQREKELILREESDFVLIHTNCGNRQLGGGRTPYGYFANQAIQHIETLAEETRKAHELVPGQFSKGKPRLEKMTEQDRLILLTHAAFEAYSGFQWLRGSSLEKIRFYFIEKQQKKEIPQPTSQEPQAHVKKSFEEMEKQYGEMKLSSKHPAMKDLDACTTDLLNTFSDGFLKEVPRALTPLKDFLAILTVHLAKDFPKETKPKASLLARQESISKLFLGGSAIDGPEFRLKRGSTTAASPRASYLDEKRELVARLQNHADIFEVAVSILEKIDKLGKK